MRLRLLVREKNGAETSPDPQLSPPKQPSGLQLSDALEMRIKAGKALGLGGPARFISSLFPP
jgi:hypothetical protein